MFWPDELLVEYRICITDPDSGKNRVIEPKLSLVKEIFTFHLMKKINNWLGPKIFSSTGTGIR
jgi:hypothetical protein